MSSKSLPFSKTIFLYNGKSQTFNCGGTGTCGTCACQVKVLNNNHSSTTVDSADNRDSGGVVVEIKDEKPKTMQRGSVEELRLKLAPHFNKNDKIRLACQCIVNENVIVEKFEGFCGRQ